MAVYHDSAWGALVEPGSDPYDLTRATGPRRRRSPRSPVATVGSVVEEALRVALARSQQVTASVGPMPVAPGSPLAGIDLDDSAALLDAMGNS